MFLKNLQNDCQFREKTKSPNEDCVNHDAVKHISFTFWTDDNKNNQYKRNFTLYLR